MKHYEIVIMVHPDQSEQVPAMLDRYASVVKNGKGVVHRLENSGRRQLAYPINKVYKAHYAVLNVECDPKIIEELVTIFRFNDAVIRHLVLTRKHAESGPSALLKKPEHAPLASEEAAQPTAE